MEAKQSLLSSNVQKIPLSILVELTNEVNNVNSFTLLLSEKKLTHRKAASCKVLLQKEGNRAHLCHLAHAQEEGEEEVVREGGPVNQR